MIVLPTPVARAKTPLNGRAASLNRLKLSLGEATAQMDVPSTLQGLQVASTVGEAHVTPVFYLQHLKLAVNDINKLLPGSVVKIEDSFFRTDFPTHWACR